MSAHFRSGMAILVYLVLGFAATARGAVLLHDDFDGPDLDPAWRVQRGYADLVTIAGNGWVDLHGSSPGTRDAAIVTGEHSDWSDYRFSTRFFAEGGGDGWYMALIHFRVQEMIGWDDGTYYYFWISTPAWGDSPGVAHVGLAHRQDGIDTTVCESTPPAGVVNDFDNTVVIDVSGARIQLWMNDLAVVDCTDPDPIPTGGVALGVVWEGSTRYDYAYVEAPNQPPVAMNDSAETPRNTPVTIAVLANDDDPDGDPVTVTDVTQPDHGSAVRNADGTITYVPPRGFTDTDSFTYSISDGQGGADTAMVTVLVTRPNRPPIAVRDVARTGRDVPVTLDVLANDRDPNGDSLTVVAIGQPRSGTAAVGADGSVTYTPAPGFRGRDSFRYEISDGRGGTDAGVVNVIVR